MNLRILPGRFDGTRKTYRSKNGKHVFEFEFASSGNHIDIYCTSRPSLNGRDSDSHKTHVFSSGQLCFVARHEPRSQQRAQELARQWAEYYLEYRRTGKAQQ